MDMNISTMPARIKSLRIDLGLTQKEFATLINVSVVSVSSYETGAKTPSLDMLINIAKKCNVSLDWLCGLRNSKFKYTTYKELLECCDNYQKPSAKLLSIMGKFHDTLNQYTHELDHMQSLKNNGLIDDELYTLWLHKQYDKFDMPICTDFVPVFDPFAENENSTLVLSKDGSSFLDNLSKITSESFSNHILAAMQLQKKINYFDEHTRYILLDATLHNQALTLYFNNEISRTIDFNDYSIQQSKSAPDEFYITNKHNVNDYHVIIFNYC